MQAERAGTPRQQRAEGVRDGSRMAEIHAVKFGAQHKSPTRRGTPI